MNVWMNLKGKQDKPMQSTIQNILIITVLAAVVGVFFVLGPFLKVKTQLVSLLIDITCMSLASTMGFPLWSCTISRQEKNV